MDKEVLSFVVEKTNELINAASCNSETKAAAESWLAAVGTDGEAEATKTYVKELEADIMPIDGLIGFAESDAGAQVFGADHAKYCDCPACAAVEAILNKKESILG